MPKFNISSGKNATTAVRRSNRCFNSRKTRNLCAEKDSPVIYFTETKVFPQDMEEMENQFEFNPTSITVEDADPFALTPKEEPEDGGFEYSIVGKSHRENIESDGEKVTTESLTNNEDVREVQEECRTNQLICCMMCNGSKINWLNRRMAQKQQLAEFLCKLFGLPSLPYETYFYEAQYCSVCHKKILKVGQLFKSLLRIQNNILEMRNQLEKQIYETSLKVLKLTKENDGITLTKEQLRVQDIRKTIIDKFELSGSDAGILDQLDNNEQRNELHFSKEAQPNEPITIASPTTNESDIDWSPNTNIGIDPHSDSSDDSDGDDPYDAPNDVNATEPIGLTLSSERELEEKGKKSIRTRRKQHQKGKILVVKLEKLTKKLEKIKISKRLKNRKAQKTNDKKRKDLISKASTKVLKDGDLQDSRYKCTLCNRRFQDIVRMKAHIKRFHEGLAYPYSCDFPSCSYSSKYLPALTIHKMDHSSGPFPYVCDVCGKGCKTVKLLQNHQKNKHFEGDRAFKCDKCQRSFLTQQKLKNHDLSHTKAFTCEICGKGFAISAFLKVHMAVKHSDENPFSCEYEGCGKSFCNKKSLEFHQFIHNKNHPFVCSVCGLGAVSQHSLTKHMRKHAVEKEFQCELCKKKFRYSHSIQKHMMAHNGIKKFECDQCDKKFIDRYKLNRHKRLHSGDRPYQCSLCHKCFYTKDYLNIHIGYHNKAAEQGKDTINQAKIKRTLDTGVSGARGSSSITSSRKMDNARSSKQETIETEPKIINDVAVLDEVTVGSTQFPPVVSTSSITPGEVFFQGEFYHIFP